MFLGSPHTHIESPISGSSLDSMIKRAVDIGRKYFSYTDPNYLTGAYSAYEKAKKKGLKFIPGIEVYFKDLECDIVKGSASYKSKYFKLTIHATDQDAYQKLCELSSKKRPVSIQSYASSFDLWGWEDIESLKDYNVTVCSSDANDLVAKHLFFNRPDISERVMLKLKSIFGDRYYACIVGNKFDKSWISLVEITYEDGKKDVVSSTDRVRTDKAKLGFLAKEIAENPGRAYFVESIIKNGVFNKVYKAVKEAKLHEGNIKLPEGDIQLKANKFVLELAKKHGVKVIYSDYAYYAEPEDKVVQDVRLSQDGIKEYVLRHMQTNQEAALYLYREMGLQKDDVIQIFNSQQEWLSKFDNFDLKYDYSIPEVEGGEDPLKRTMRIISETGRMKWDNPVYTDRLKYEIQVLANNGKVNLLPYFFPIRDILDFYHQNGRLTGPARGSAAGCLLMYLMGITHVDPIKHGLSFERFLSLDRILTGNWPDVDVDLVNREPLVGEDGQGGYLYGRWKDKAAQISTRTLLRLKSSIKDVNRFFHGAVEPEIEKLSKSLPAAPQGVSDADYVFGFEDDDGNHQPGLIEINDDLKAYVQGRPQEWDVVVRCLGIPRQNSKHASAFVIADKPVSQIVPMFGDNITQYDAKAVEKAKLIKYDFLVINQLADIEKCIELVNKKAGVDLSSGRFRHNSKDTYIWDLPEEEDVFRSIWEGETSTLFQINTQSMVPFVQRILPKSIKDLSDILALVRPGPLDFVDEVTGRNMAEEYIERRKGRSTPDMKELADLLPETYGIAVYQEQVSEISKKLGDMKPGDAEELRRVFSKKDKKKSLEMKPLFMEGAVKKLGEEKAEKIWSMMETFSRYGFNKSHSVSYAMITYACMYLKFHYPLEWWAAVLSNATEEEISNELFKHVSDLVAPPDINLSSDEMVVDYDNKKIRSKLSVLKGLGESSVKPIVESRPYRDIQDFVDKKVATPSLTRKLIHVGVMDSLFRPGASLLQKMQEFEDAVNMSAYQVKVSKGQKPRPPKPGKIDEKYIGMNALADYAEKKSIYSTLNSNLFELMIKHSKRVQEGTEEKPIASCSRQRPVRFLDGEQVRTIDPMVTSNDQYFAYPGYIIKCEEFSYSKGTKKAIKLIIDSDGYIVERVIWPDYDTGRLREYDGLKKGAVAIVFLKKRADREGTQIYDIVVQHAP
jgi:DNA-directed DNA polymerase III PolC